MPTIRVEMFPGRTPEQKEKLAQRFTQAFVEEAGAKAESVHVVFYDVSPGDWAVGGRLCAPRQST